MRRTAGAVDQIIFRRRWKVTSRTDLKESVQQRFVNNIRPKVCMELHRFRDAARHPALLPCVRLVREIDLGIAF